MKLYYQINANQSKLSKFPSSTKRTKMDEISWFNDVYSDMFSLVFDNLFNTIDFESFESKENDSGTRVNNNTSTASQRPALTETTLETNNLPAPDESRFPLTSNSQRGRK